MQNDSDFVGDVLKIGLGVAFGGFLLWIGHEYYVRYEAEQVLQAVQAAMDQSAAAQRQLQRQRDGDALQAHIEAQAARRADLVRKAQLTQAQADRAKQIDEANQRKDAAWRAYYQPAGKCADPTRNDVLVECGNAHIRARREFELNWEKSQGKQ